MSQIIRQQFTNSFDFRSKNFSNPVELIDSPVGFSVYKKIFQSGYASLFLFWITQENLDINSNYKPIYIRVNHGKSDNAGSIILSGSGFKRKIITGPVDLESKDEYFYDPQQNKFYNKRKKEVNPNDIVDKIYSLHIKPTRFFRGSWLRTKLLFRVGVSGIVWLIHYGFAFFLYIISGTKITKNSIYLNLREDKSQESLRDSKVEFHEKDRIEFLGYRGRFFPIVFYSAFHIILYIFFYFLNFKPNIIKILLNNNFLTLIYIITTLSFIEIGLPRILKYLIVRTSRLYFYCLSKRIKL